MTQISDDRLMEIKARGNQFFDKSRGSYGIPAIEMEQIIDELLSARETIRRLVKYTDHHSGCLSEASNRDGDCTCGYTALLAELEGKGPQLTESHGK